MFKLAPNGERLIRELGLGEQIDSDIKQIAQEAKLWMKRPYQLKYLNNIEKLCEISLRYLANVKPEAKKKAIVTLRDYGISDEMHELLLQLTLGVYILERCVETKQLSKEFLCLLERVQEEYEAFKKEGAETYAIKPKNP